jgi:hypothetical protein
VIPRFQGAGLGVRERYHAEHGRWDEASPARRWDGDDLAAGQLHGSSASRANRFGRRTGCGANNGCRSERRGQTCLEPSGCSQRLGFGIAGRSRLGITCESVCVASRIRFTRRQRAARDEAFGTASEPAGTRDRRR